MVAVLQAYPLASCSPRPPTRTPRRLHACSPPRRPPISMLSSRSARRRGRPRRWSTCRATTTRTTTIRLHLQELLAHELGGTDVEYTEHVGDGPRALLQVLMSVDADGDLRRTPPAVRAAGAAGRLARLIRTWDERLAASMGTDIDDEVASGLMAFVGSVSPAYQEVRDPRRAYDDLRILAPMAPATRGHRTRREHRRAVPVWRIDAISPTCSLSSTAWVCGCRAGVRIDRPDGVTCWAYELAPSHCRTNRTTVTPMAPRTPTSGPDASSTRSRRLSNAGRRIQRAGAQHWSDVARGGCAARLPAATCASAGLPTAPPTSPTSSPGMQA